MRSDRTYAQMLNDIYRDYQQGFLTESEYRSLVLGIGVTRLQAAPPEVQREARRGAAIDPCRRRW